mmetsp:Transcript_14822/g.36338  ORF Transcript_14822/g.36338 Transcript_14822/m.36338 type:complete len:254 (-) Transcript_14822:332-1093(-)
MAITRTAGTVSAAVFTTPRTASRATGVGRKLWRRTCSAPRRGAGKGDSPSLSAECVFATVTVRTSTMPCCRASGHALSAEVVAARGARTAATADLAARPRGSPQRTRSSKWHVPTALTTFTTTSFTLLRGHRLTSCSNGKRALPGVSGLPRISQRRGKSPRPLPRLPRSTSRLRTTTTTTTMLTRTTSFRMLTKGSRPSVAVRRTWNRQQVLGTKMATMRMARSTPPPWMMSTKDRAALSAIQTRAKIKLLCW